MRETFWYWLSKKAERVSRYARSKYVARLRQSRTVLQTGFLEPDNPLRHDYGPLRGVTFEQLKRRQEVSSEEEKHG